MMLKRLSLPIISFLLLSIVSCNSQEALPELDKNTTDETAHEASAKKAPHRYGGWYCPDNFGFEPVDIQKLEEVPAVEGRLPTEDELREHKSLISVDTNTYPDARALNMDLPRVARIHSDNKGIDELIIVIQAIIVQGDTVVGYRFPNGGNGSARLNEVKFLSENELAELGSQPYYFNRSEIHSGTEGIWRALSGTDYFEQLGEKFDKKDFFLSKWDPEAKAYLNRDTGSEKATGYVGMVFGNYYMHIDYIRDGLHYSEKLLIVENRENNTSELFFASGPYPRDFNSQKSQWDNWLDKVVKASEVR